MKYKSYNTYGNSNSVGVPTGGLDTALKIWKRNSKESDIFTKLKKKSYYEKKSASKRERNNRAVFYQKCDADRIKLDRKKSTCWSDSYIVLLAND